MWRKRRNYRYYDLRIDEILREIENIEITQKRMIMELIQAIINKKSEE